jgi:hypothetical protein
MAATPRMTEVEKALVRRMSWDQGQPPTAIAQALGRHVSSITRLLHSKTRQRRPGRKTCLSPKRLDQVEATLKAMVAKANGQYEVTLHKLATKSRLKCSLKTLQPEPWLLDRAGSFDELSRRRPSEASPARQGDPVPQVPGETGAHRIRCEGALRVGPEVPQETGPRTRLPTCLMSGRSPPSDLVSGWSS